MKKKQIISIIVAMVFILSGLPSCNSPLPQNTDGKPSSMGSTSEVLVVLQNEDQWDNPIGVTIRKYFTASIYGLPQNEPIFKLLHIKASLFNNLFKKERNIFIVHIDPKIKAPEITIMKDVWAAPQLVFKLTAPSVMSFVDVFTDRKNLFIQKYMAAERQRILEVFSTALDVKIMQKIKSQFGFSLDTPVGFYVAKAQPGFMWIRHEANMYSQAIMILSVPYVDTAQFSRESILSRIQNYQRRYIPGPTQGSFMALDRKFVIPRYTRITTFPTKYAVEIRGLWRVEHDFMGGPFISYTFLDPSINEIVTLFGYVYYPNHNTRDLLLQVESILYSVKFNKTGKK